MFRSGSLQAMVDAGLRGMTSNPTIFATAMGTGADYDERLRTIVQAKSDPIDLFESLAMDDIRAACDISVPIYDATSAQDDYVSLEVSPALAHDGIQTLAAAKRLWRAVGRKNVMIKIPGTPEGMAAIRSAIADGININVTMLFSVEAYTCAAEAYMGGLQDRLNAGHPISRIASVASVFVSRIDAAIDALLKDKLAQGDDVAHLLGKRALPIRN